MLAGTSVDCCIVMDLGKPCRWDCLLAAQSLQAPCSAPAALAVCSVGRCWRSRSEPVGKPRLWLTGSAAAGLFVPTRRECSCSSPPAFSELLVTQWKGFQIRAGMVMEEDCVTGAALSSPKDREWRLGSTRQKEAEQGERMAQMFARVSKDPRRLLQPGQKCWRSLVLPACRQKWCGSANLNSLGSICLLHCCRQKGERRGLKNWLGKN